MKNQYTKFVKHIEKQGILYAQRADNSIYLTDGKIALMVPCVVYDQLIRPQSGILPDMPEDCKACKEPYDPCAKINNASIDIRKAVSCLNTDEILDKSPFFLELPQQGKRQKKPVLCRVFRSRFGYIGVNETYLDIFAECLISDVWRSSGRWNDPIVQKDDDSMLVVFPTKLDVPAFDFWKEGVQ